MTDIIACCQIFFIKAKQINKLEFEINIHMHSIAASVGGHLYKYEWGHLGRIILITAKCQEIYKFCILLFHYLIRVSILSWWNKHYLHPLSSHFLCSPWAAEAQRLINSISLHNTGEKHIQHPTCPTSDTESNSHVDQQHIACFAIKITKHLVLISWTLNHWPQKDVSPAFSTWLTFFFCRNK